MRPLMYSSIARSGQFRQSVSFHGKKLIILLFLVILSSMDFYSPSFLPIPPTVSKLVYYFFVCLFGILSFRNKKKVLTGTDNVKKVMKFMLLGLFLSAFNAYIYKDQPFLISFIATMQRIGFLVFIFLCNSQLRIPQLENVIKWFCYIYIVVATINFIFGYAIFGTSDIDLDRGGVRFRLAGLEWVQMYLLIVLNKYILEGDKKYLYFSIFLFLFVVMSLTRQVIAITFIAALLMYLINVKFYKKVLLFLVMAFFMSVVLPHIPLYQKLQEKTESQVEMNDKTDDVRIVAFNYFAFDYPRNIQQVLFGVGIPSFGNSKYGIEYERNQEATRLFREDVGYAGFYYDHGIVTLGLLILAILLCMNKKTNRNTLYAKYYLFIILLESVASTPFTSCTLSIMLMMYVLNLNQKEALK